MRRVPMRGGRGIIGIWISGVWIVMDVRVPIVSVRIIIQVARRTIVSARKSKTEALSSGNQDSRFGLSIRTLNWKQRESAIARAVKISFCMTSPFVCPFSFLFARDRDLLRIFLDAFRKHLSHYLIRAKLLPWFPKGTKIEERLAIAVWRH
jgi:hypothetical protein